MPDDSKARAGFTIGLVLRSPEKINQMSIFYSNLLLAVYLKPYQKLFL